MTRRAWGLGLRLQGRLGRICRSQEWSAWGARKRSQWVSWKVAGAGRGGAGRGGPLGSFLQHSSRCPGYPREQRRVKPDTPKGRARRRRRFYTRSSRCSQLGRSAAGGLAHGVGGSLLPRPAPPRPQGPAPPPGPAPPVSPVPPPPNLGSLPTASPRPLGLCR